jgi:prepilin-type processing-associated H-X9-DG protein
MFWHPAKAKFDAPTFISGTRYWSTFGQINGSFALNVSITGALNTADIPMATQRVIRDSWTGGTQTALGAPAQTLLLMETGSPLTSIIPMGILNGSYSNQSVIGYPGIVRETMINDFYIHPSGCPGTPGGILDTTAIVNEGMTIGFADGHAKFVKVNKMIADTPTIAEYSPGTANNCFIAGSTQRLGNTVNTNINYPFWGLTN